ARSRLGLVLGGELGFYPRATARDNLLFFADIQGLDARRRHSAVMDALERVGLVEAASRKAGELSRGMRQRLHLARALLGSPALLLLDEPTTGMDVTARRTFWERMDKLAETGKTIIFATHYLEEAQNFAQRIVLMRDGAIIADGTSEEIRDLTGYRHVSFLADAPLSFDDLPHQQVEITQENGKYRHRLNVSDAEDFVRLLLNTQVVSDLEIVKPSMDESFMLLTSDTESAASSATKES
ncbi:ABC transporter ATP-binding protein, partial [uncultured Rothia sp.]|uniref:ABC transporter ATP-binding protein n=1 Tax=uncultured Rothia sp. TaxID=316088 RepID=UPI002625BB8B